MSRRRDKIVNLRVRIDGEVYSSPVTTDVPLLDNIEGMNIDIRSSCRRGLCGSCRITLIEGELEESSVYMDDYVLSCASYLESDAEVFIED